MKDYQDKMAYPGKKKKLPQWVILNKRIDTGGKVFYQGGYYDLNKYPELKKALYGSGHDKRSYITK